MLAHFFLQTTAGSLLFVLAAIAAVGTVVWVLVDVSVTLVAVAAWWAYRTVVPTHHGDDEPSGRRKGR